MESFDSSPELSLGPHPPRAKSPPLASTQEPTRDGLGRNPPSEFLPKTVQKNTYCPRGCTRNRSLVNGTKGSNLRSPGGLILTHTHMGKVSIEYTKPKFVGPH